MQTALARLNRRLRPWSLRVEEVPVWLFGLAFAMIWVMPFVWMVATYPVLRWMLNSVIVVTISTALCVLSGAMAGYALARLRFPGRNLLFLLYVSALMVPIEVYVVPLLLGIIKIGWANTYQALILPTV